METNFKVGEKIVHETQWSTRYCTVRGVYVKASGEGFYYDVGINNPLDSDLRTPTEEEIKRFYI